MDENITEQETRDNIAQRFKTLPKVVQDAILSADVQEQMRELADAHKLHFDQWSILENEVMFALLGLEPIENLAGNIEHEVGVPSDVAQVLAQDISLKVFEPIRAELEASLQFPHEQAGVKAGEQTTVDYQPSSAATVAGEHPLAQIVPAIAPIFPGTPPAPPPEERAVRAPISEAYLAGERSVERRSVADDPYRETPM